MTNQINVLRQMAKTNPDLRLSTQWVKAVRKAKSIQKKLKKQSKKTQTWKIELKETIPNWTKSNIPESWNQFLNPSF